MKEKNPNWERETITELAWEGLREKRRSRRWGIFFKILMFLYLLGFIFAISGWPKVKSSASGSHTALIKLKGVIADGGDSSSDEINRLLKNAFEDEDTKGIILEINSPGGTPVQAAEIYNEIRRLKEMHKDIPLYAVITDLCASGGYYVAAAADEIYANKASIVGSIGVRLDSYGVSKLAEKIGVESRTITAGKNKALLDPFSQLDPEQKQHLQKMLNQVHQLFIADVRAGRGDRLKETPDIFSGLIWSGEAAKELGLIDDFGSTALVARDIIEEENIVEYEAKKTLLQQITEDAGKISGEFVGNLFTTQPINQIVLQ
jgi:protease-4